MTLEHSYIFFLTTFFLFGYFIGSIPFGLILTKISGLGDIRYIGSDSTMSGSNFTTYFILICVLARWFSVLIRMLCYRCSGGGDAIRYVKYTTLLRECKHSDLRIYSIFNSIKLI